MRRWARSIPAELLIPVIALLAGARPVSAHHAFAAEYDAAQPVLLTGIVTSVEWTNPHARFVMKVREGSGKAVSWELELGSPNALQREGWSRKSLKPGDQVTVSGYRAKDGSNLANARDIRLADGRKVLTGSSASPAPLQ